MLYTDKSVNSVKWYETAKNEKLSANFRVQEFDPGRRYDRVPIHPDLVRGLQLLRDKFGLPLIITSGYRAPAHNAGVESAALGSLHQYGLAVDFGISGVSHELVARTALEIFGGVGLYSSHVHVDVGPVRHWIQGVSTSAASMFLQMGEARKKKASSTSSSFFDRWLANMGSIWQDLIIEPVGGAAEAVSKTVKGTAESLNIAADAIPTITRVAKYSVLVGIPAVVGVTVLSIGARVAGGQLALGRAKATHFRPKPVPYRPANRLYDDRKNNRNAQAFNKYHGHK